jgi:PIN domain
LGTVSYVLCLLADTSVWLDLTKSISGEQLIAECQVLVDQGRLELLVPQIVVEEFAKSRDRIEADMALSLASTLRSLRATTDEDGPEDDRKLAVKQLDEITQRVPLVNQRATRLFSEILDMLSTGRILEPSAEVNGLAVRRGLEMRAPFHRSRNSVPDALLIEMYGEALANDAGTANDYCFVTTNTKDFSLTDGNIREPHADIAGFFTDSRSRYFTSLAAALAAYFPEETDQLLADLDLRDEPRSLGVIMPLINKLWDQIWYNRHKNLEHRIEIGEVELVDEYYPEAHERTVLRSVWERAQAAALSLEERYEPGELGPWDDFEWGMLSGRMSALRWVLGEDWESTLDT